ncbi:serine/threonine-protein kinase [Streptosporangium saharense]|uniref:non-specific serine/threonine protein kinase n=1 Tax=Streptosporangium saharense TaxID=1706840 RepID=A0A7W7QQI4_9ACTN|nr:serine/threonine-protein kinase [Streptosporangium saharense]MBB4917935.1 serine/threonine protein kinase [Streptosporangium saharense]
MPEQQTRVLADRYELITPLGRGTMGTVWRAHDRSLGREVAIKEIRQEPGLSEAQRAELRERMIREGRTAARISHPSVATVHDAIVEDGSPWIIMELVQARSLEQVIEEEGPLPPRLVAEIGVDLLGALRAAHDQGILHRDVKPGNVLITETGRVVLTDFGIAKAEGDSSLTKTGMVIGSPGYTAPERARGEHTGPESDLWSLGATLYFAVEGRPAYERSSVAETLAALMTDKADSPTQAGPLRPVLEHLLERDHTARPTHLQAIAMLRTVADTPTGSIPVVPALDPPGTSQKPAVQKPAAQKPAVQKPAVQEPAPRKTASPEEAPASAAQEDDEEFDANRTVVVIRPKGGLRLPPGPQNAAPAPARPAVPGLGTPVAGARTATPPPAPPVPPVQDRPVAGPSVPPPYPQQGFPPPQGPQRRPPFQGPPPQGPPPQGPPQGPWAPTGPRSPGLGTDLFAFTGQDGRPVQNGQAPQPSSRSKVGVLVLMGIAALALVVIVILGVSFLTG